MSTVTNLVLTFDILEDEEARIREVNSFFEDKESGNYCPKGFVSIDDESLPRGWYGGSKMFEAPLLTGAFNSLYEKEFLQHLLKVSWQYPEDVQLFIKRQDDDRFSLYSVKDIAEQIEYIEKDEAGWLLPHGEEDGEE